LISRELGWLQVAALLVSASYGVGFLFGSGELAVTHGMAGSLYPWLTALGMALLAVSAGRVWMSRAPIWDMFGALYGAGVKRQVALLSLIWMTGVLAAQIHGGMAVLLLAGVPQSLALPIMLVLMFGAAQLDLQAASKVFSLCLLASSFVLVFSLVKMGGTHVYVEAVPRFGKDVQGMSVRELVTMTLAIVFLVVTGADYQQFVIAARSRTDAIVGCSLAAVCLLLLGALPASTVIAAQHTGLLDGLLSAKQAILSHAGPRWDAAMLMTLLAAALGSGAAIVRAMTSALASVITPTTASRRAGASLAVVLLGGIVAQRGQGIIQTMVELNIVYVASVAPLFIFQSIGAHVPPNAAKKAIAAGFTAAALLYVGEWAGLVRGQIELASLGIGTLASFAVLETYRRKAAQSACSRGHANQYVVNELSCIDRRERLVVTARVVRCIE